MNDLISQKVVEARELFTQADAEDSEGSRLEAEARALLERSKDLLKSGRAKRAIAQSLLDTIEQLNREEAANAAPVVVTTAIAAVPAKKGGRKKAAAQPTVALAPVAKKGGRGAKAKATAPKTTAVTKAPKGKPAKPKKAAAEAAEVTTAITRTPAQRNGLPPLRDRLRVVIGNDEVTIADAITRLKAHNKAWVPQSDDLSAYISLMLSTHAKPGDVFERVKRGVYRVAKSGATPPKGGAGAPALKAPSAPKGGGAAVKKTKGNGHVNGASNGIEDLGSNVLDNPFAGASDAAA